MHSLFPGTSEKAPLWGAFFVAALLWLLPAQAATAEACAMPAGLREARVERVVDGDTLRLADGRSVRLIGLNTPETARSGRPAEPFAVEATRHLERLVAASAGRVYLQPGVQPRDRYGRSLAHAFGRDGRSWASAQLAAGLGLAVALAPNTARLDCLLAAEAQARAARRGLWRRNPQRKVGQLQAGGFALLSGRIESFERNRGGLWLRMDGALVLRVAPQRIARFDPDALRALVGRRVEVRGWVVERSRRGALRPGQARWQLSLDHPALLRRL